MLFVSLLSWLPLQAGPATEAPRPRPQQERNARFEGGGVLTVDGQALVFEPLDLQVGSHAKLGRAIHLQGTLRPKAGEPWTFDLQFTEKGQLLLLQFFRKERGHETGRWSPTMKSKVEVVAFHPEAGGQVRLRFSGPVSGVLGAMSKQSSWSGELFVTVK